MKLDLVFCHKCQSSHGPRQPCQDRVEPTSSTLSTSRKDGDASAPETMGRAPETKPLTTDVLAGAESFPLLGPPHLGKIILPAIHAGEEEIARIEKAEKRKKKKPRRGRFDKNEYQKNYMRDWYRPAKKLGLTVEEYRLKLQ